MASAEKLVSGWRGVYYVHGEKRHTKPPHHARKRDAIAAAEDARVVAYRQAAQVEKTLSAGLTWGEWWDLLAQKRVFDDSETGITEANMVDVYLRPQWGDTPLNKIGKKSIQDWIDALVAGTAPKELKRACYAKDKLSPAYIRRIYGPFTVSINKALDDGVLQASPCVGVTLPRVPKRARQYLSVAGAEKLGEHLRGDYKDAIDFGLETGLRPGELCGLHIACLDLETGWMQVQDVLVRRLKVMRPCPKDEDVRLVALSDRAIEIATRRIRNRHATCGVQHTGGARCESDVLFRTDRGRIMSQEVLTQRMRDASAAAGIPRRSAYDVRRGHATLMAEGGIDPYELARSMGWEDINQAWSYVQQTPAARARVLAALRAGSAPELRVVPGGGLGRSGMPSGTDLPLMASDETGRRLRENAG